MATELLQMSVTANMQTAAAAGSPALAALLRALTAQGPLSGQQEKCRETAAIALRCFLLPFKLATLAPTAAPLLKQLWQRVMERPSALAATVEAFQLCQTPRAVKIAENFLIATAVRLHTDKLSPGNSDGRVFPGWPAILAADSLQQYAMDVLAAAAVVPSQPPSHAQADIDSVTCLAPFRAFLAEAAGAGQIGRTACIPSSLTRACLRPFGRRRQAMQASVMCPCP